METLAETPVNRALGRDEQSGKGRGGIREIGFHRKGEVRAGVTDIQYIRLMILDPFKTAETSLSAPREIIRRADRFYGFSSDTHVLLLYYIIIRTSVIAMTTAQNKQGL